MQCPNEELLQEANEHFKNEEFLEAKEKYEALLKIEETCSDEKKMFDILHNLADTLSNEGGAAEAKAIYRKVVAGKTSHYGPSHRSTIKTVSM